VVWTCGPALRASWAACVAIEICASASAVQRIGATVVFHTSRIVITVFLAAEAGDAAGGAVVAWSTSTLAVGVRALGALGVFRVLEAATPTLWATRFTVVREATTLCVSAGRITFLSGNLRNGGNDEELHF